MNALVKEKLEEVVALLNDPEATVLDNELKDKLEKIIELLGNSETGDVKAKLEKVAQLVEKAMVDPDIDVEYYMSGIGESTEPVILITYIVSQYNKPTRKIRLGKTALQDSAEEIMNHVTSSITEFKSEIDSVEMG